MQNGQKYPVVVYLHGGEFKVGSKFVSSPELIVNKNVVLVTVNYRLGVFGMICVSLFFQKKTKTHGISIFCCSLFLTLFSHNQSTEKQAF